MGDGSDPFSALLSGLQNSEAVAQQENPYPDIASGIAHLQLGPAMTIYGMPIAEQANPTKYAIEKALLGAGTGLAQGAGIGLQQQNNTDLTNAFLTGDHSNISPEMWAPMQNAMGLFGQAQQAQKGMESFKNDLDMKRTLTEGIAKGEVDPGNPMVMKLFGGGPGSSAAPTFGATGSNPLDSAFGSGSGASTPPTNLVSKPSVVSNDGLYSGFKLPPNKIVEQGKDTQDLLTTSSTATIYQNALNNYKDMISAAGTLDGPSSSILVQKLAELNATHPRFNAATGQVATGDPGVAMQIENFTNQLKGGGSLSPASVGQALGSASHLIDNEYQGYNDQVMPKARSYTSMGGDSRFVTPLSAPDHVSAANSLYAALAANPKASPRVAAATVLSAYPSMALVKDANGIHLVPKSSIQDSGDASSGQ